MNATESRILGFLLAPNSPVPSPCFVIDLEKLRANAQTLAAVQDATGARILLALKAYSAWATFPVLSRAFQGPLWGTCASSVDEARLGREEFGGEVHAFAAAWSESEIAALSGIADHIVFNSLEQWRRFKPIVLNVNKGIRRSSPISCGLRVNPEHSEGAPAIYNPCAPGSRLGIRAREFTNACVQDFSQISGLHFHSLCEQGAEALARTLPVFADIYRHFPVKCQWLNFGGGHHITKPGYNLDLLCRLLNEWRERSGCQIYLEPGEAVALDAGWLLATVLDIIEADMPVAILDVSAACHMPDVLEMPYHPDVWRWHNGAPELAAQGAGETIRLAGKSCLAGDIIGEYTFSSPLKIGDRLAFADMAIYSMVKTTTFNGLRLPTLGLYDPKSFDKFRILREFSYEDFKSRLS